MVKIPEEKNKKSHSEFTPKENMLLTKRYGRVSWTELKSLFPDHHIETVITHAENDLGLKRDFPGSYPRAGRNNPWYYNFGYCYAHGKIPIKKLKKGSKGGLFCPKCGRKVRTGPRSNKHKEKYIIEKRKKKQ